MPRLPTITERVIPEPVQYPRPTAESYGAGIGEALISIGETLGGVGQKLQDQQDELDLYDLKGRYDAGIEAIKLELSKNPDYQTHEQKFVQQAKNLQASLLKETNRGPIQRVLSGHFSEKLPQETVNVRANAYKLWAETQFVALDQQTTALATEAARGTSPEVYKGAVAAHEILIDRAAQRGLLSPQAAQVYRETFIKETDIAAARFERQQKRLTEQQRDDENVTLFRKMAEDSLTAADVLRSPYLNRDDMQFFLSAMEKKTEPKTDPSTAVTIENLLSTPAATREEAVKNASTAKLLAQKAYVQDSTLAKDDALAMLKRANAILEGKDLDQDRWFELSKSFLKDKFGWQGGVVGRFLNPDGAARYWKLVSQLMAEQEANPVMMSGKAVYDRAVQLAESEAVDYWTKEATKPTPPATETMPPAANYPGRLIQDNHTGKKYRSDGTQWIEVD